MTGFEFHRTLRPGNKINHLTRQTSEKRGRISATLQPHATGKISVVPPGRTTPGMFRQVGRPIGLLSAYGLTHAPPSVPNESSLQWSPLVSPWDRPLCADFPDSTRDWDTKTASAYLRCGEHDWKAYHAESGGRWPQGVNRAERAGWT